MQFYFSTKRTGIYTHSLPSVWRHVRLRAPLRSPCGRLVVALRAPWGCLASALKILWPPQRRPKVTVRHKIKDRTAPTRFRSPQFLNTPCGYPKNKNICDCYIVWPWKYCGRPIIASGRRFCRPYGRRAKCDLGLNQQVHCLQGIAHKA